MQLNWIPLRFNLTTPRKLKNYYANTKVLYFKCPAEFLKSDVKCKTKIVLVYLRHANKLLVALINSCNASCTADKYFTYYRFNRNPYKATENLSSAVLNLLK